MFDRAIIDTDRFMDLSMTAKALYFLLGMEADDEGFVSYKKVMRIHGGNEDDMKILVLKNFLIHFDSGVVVVTDWNKNNYMDKNRIRPTEYQHEKKQLLLTETKDYVLNNRLPSIEERRGEERSIDTLSVDNSLDKEENSKVFEEWWTTYPSTKRNVVKDKARAKFLKGALSEEALRRLAVLKDQKARDRKWIGGFIPNMSTYLNQERWNMDIEVETITNQQQSFKV